MLQGLFPMALNGAVGRIVADMSPWTVLDGEVGLEHDMLVGCTVLTDATKVLVTPCDEVAQQHDVIATIHLGTGLVAIP